MADEAPPNSDSDSDRERCSPCRGTGTVVSGKGGEPHEVTCPWCDGSGRYIAGHDAQKREAATA